MSLAGTGLLFLPLLCLNLYDLSELISAGE
jgi:hypothetical protein